MWYGPDRLPTYCLPPLSVRADLLTPSSSGSSAPAAFIEPHDVRAGTSAREGAAFLLRDSPAPFEAADGYWTFTWDDPSVEWYEEATRVHLVDDVLFTLLDAIDNDDLRLGLSDGTDYHDLSELGQGEYIGSDDGWRFVYSNRPANDC